MLISEQRQRGAVMMNFAEYDLAKLEMSLREKHAARMRFVRIARRKQRAG
jgi:hypothetical protein